MRMREVGGDVISLGWESSVVCFYKVGSWWWTGRASFTVSLNSLSGQLK